MTSVLNSLMSGGYEPDNDMSLASEHELWLNDMQEKVAKMSTQELYAKRLLAIMENDNVEYSIYDEELKARGETVNIQPCSTLADEPLWMDDPDHEDRRKDYLENYAADDELPF